jgi:chromosome segregation ATPase
VLVLLISPHVSSVQLTFTDSYRERIKQLEEALDKESKQTIELSDKLENPENLERWRPLDGSDLDLEQLVAKIKVLEDRLDHKREQLLEKELILEEVTALTDKLRTQAVSKRDAAKVLADQLNELHGRIRDVTKKMLASVSELSMYQVHCALYTVWAGAGAVLRVSLNKSVVTALTASRECCSTVCIGVLTL